MDLFDRKNREFFDFLDQTFGISKAKSWKEISQSISQLKIKLTYRKFAELFPRQLNYSAELKKMQNQFSSIHYGTLKATTIIDEIVRFSLYSDSIIVFHPLQNPAVTNQNMDPGRNPKYWLQDFLDALYFYIVIQKWVREGIVKLIINPYEYDLSLRDAIDIRVKARVDKLDKEKYFQASKETTTEFFAEQFAVGMQGRSKDDIVKVLLQMQSPRFTMIEAQDLASQILNAFTRVNPLYKNLNISMRGSTFLATIKGGGPLESVLMVSDLTGGNIYTPRQATWMQIQEAGIDEFWLKINKAYGKLPLTFLNGVDTSFALELRKEDRLAGVRQEMKRVFGELKSIDIKDLTETRFRDLHESFLEAVKSSDAEWEMINRQARTRNIVLASGIAAPLISNDFSWLPLSIASFASMYQNTKSTTDSKQAFRDKNPISVFVDLKNRKQGFLSSLKNCVF